MRRIVGGGRVRTYRTEDLMRQIRFVPHIRAAFLLVAMTAVAHADTTMPVREGDLSCDRACLKQFVDQYLQAMVAHDPSRLPLTSDVKFTENTVRLNFTEGLWKTATGLGSYKLYITDPWAQHAGFMGVVMERDGPKFLGLRLRIKNKQIREVETVVGRPGSSDPLPANLATVMPKAFWTEPLKAGERVSRDVMITAANSYFEAIEKDASGVVPWDDSCTMGGSREANGARAPDTPEKATQAPMPPQMAEMMALKCDGIFGKGMMGGLLIPERHFWLIDEEQGIVFGAFMFSIDAPALIEPGRRVALGGDLQKQPNAGIIAEAFKIKSGKVYGINAVTGSTYAYGTRSGW